ncbi:TraR/DksA C4-type zinc finger protein [Dactylosporangium roseum]|uniref:TraR/DksA C4-type zinc finger protein n=1 Tax=Dactylosporangium roseum TaxID=47989 RepID=A0ABY5YY09_9ACTN|nr:TraR/DksA C4-type zinc finger protein [Dactylosporangium roseum]UWZ34276.1 TraR/DksA C4-type zinc finger protein [Dactylosporangium roseum]
MTELARARVPEVGAPPAGIPRSATASLRELLERQFQDYTEQLIGLTVPGRLPDSDVHHPDTVRTLMRTARQGIADTTEALRRMSEGGYGRCGRCDREIPLVRLRAAPSARWCEPCQQHHASVRHGHEPGPAGC